jgi:hypothetical protein
MSTITTVVLQQSSQVLSGVLNWFQTWIQTLQVVTNTLLTGALVYLYYRQKEILSEQMEVQQEQSRTKQEQTEIQAQQSKTMESQESLLQLEYRPRLLVEEWGINSNEVYADLANIGGGDALQLDLHLEFLPKDELYYPTDMELSEYETSLHNKETSVDGQYSKVIENGYTGNYRTNRNEFVPEEQSDNNMRTVEFTDIIKNFDRDYVEIRLWIEYEDILGDTHTNHFSRLSTDIPTSKDVSLKELISSSSDIMYFPNSMKPVLHR